MKLLFVGNIPGVIGGQNRVAYYTLREMKQLGWEVAACGKGIGVLPPGEAPLGQNHPLDPINIATIKRAIDMEKPDVIIFSHDIWFFYIVIELRKQYPKIKFVGWFTVDAHPIHSSWIEILRAMDVTCVSTEFGRQVIYQRFPERSVEVIEYGVDLDQYTLPTSERKTELRVEFGKTNKRPDFNDACVFCFAGQNQVKKSIGAMVDAFDSLGNVNAYLILALKFMDNQLGAYQYKGEFDLADLVSNPRILVIDAILDNKCHAEIFQMSDFLLYPSQGEAPGLQMAEAQLCGCIPIATNYTGLPEESCWPEFLIDDFVLHRGQFNCFRAIVGMDALAQKMSRAIDFREELLDDKGSLKGIVAKSKKVERQDLIKEKFSIRTWKNTAIKLDEACRSTLDNCVRIDSSLMAI